MDKKKVDSLSKTTSEKRDELFSWFTSQGDVIRIAAVQEQGELAFRHKDEYQKAYRAEFYYAMLVRAVAKLRWIESSHAQKAALADEEAHELTARRRERFKNKAAARRHKPSPKKEVIRVRFFEEIKQLRGEGFSWRQITEFLKEYRKAVFGWSYLKTTYEALEKERAMEVEA